MKTEIWETAKGEKVEVRIEEVGVPESQKREDKRKNYQRVAVDTCANCLLAEPTFEKYHDWRCSLNDWYCPVDPLFRCDEWKQRTRRCGE